MRWSIYLPLLIVVMALLAQTHAVTAQSSRAYPWCSRDDRTGSRSCSFATREQCMATMSGLGGRCYANPRYSGRRH